MRLAREESSREFLWKEAEWEKLEGRCWKPQGELADRQEIVNVRQFNWFESDLCILATSAQIAAFEMLKMTGPQWNQEHL